MQNSTPPNATKKTHEMTIHGDTRVDDYYWMRLTDEQKSAKDKDSQTQEVLDYINAENAYTQKRLKHTEKFQNDLFDEIVGRIKKDDESVPYLDNGYYYYTRYEKGKEYAIHCRKKGSLDGDEEVIMDENELAEGFDYFAIGSMSVSPDNQWLAFGVDTLSRRFYEINFKNLNTGDILQQTIENTTGGVAWANDNETVFYTSKNKVTLLSEKIYRHKVGSDYKNDALVYTEDDESYYIGVSRSKSGEYIIIYNSSTLVSDYHILRADNPEGDFKNFSPRGAAHEYGIDHYKDKFYIITNWEAKNNRLMETSEDATDMGNWKEVIAHRNDVHLLGLEIFNNHLVISERKDGLRGLRVMNQKTGSDEYINFGEQTYTARISVNEEFNTNILRYGYTSMVTPSSTYDYNMDTGEITLMKQQEVVGGYDQSLYRSERHYAPGRDGQPVPISLVYKKDLKNDPTFNNQGAPDNPQNLLLYAYGSYGSTRDPYFSSTRLSLLDRGFIYAIAHVRGSQIYGRQSYDDGKMLNKKNTFTDFIDAGKYLVKEGLTDSNHLFAEGGSAGGLLIGAVVNMAPELWKGTIAAVPFVDVVTTMLDASIPLTSNEWDEWGNPEEKKYYDYMLSYSPYDQVEDQIYPNILVTSGFFDSQVQYWEPLKWMAKLRDHWQGENNLYLHMNMDAGHGGKSGRFRRYREVALEYAFLFDLAGIKD
ncbi:MAG: S9 family peptidase [Candidatus Marinimicrobia bacterium]|jgi:oligopeptidase B|nr:S9 family peptidase [Candidatus Neomarinimicrobiota bacterium]MBT5386465.1 S9 family peptidase [Candidatus Neomarinimicrobiota bacterium]|tara:strand:- start:226 stop:2340 length:2115 start_codon:yes stop_codon:yes gene_type:complete